MKHLEAAKVRLENLWAAGTDYSRENVANARENNLMLHLDMDLTGECKLKCFYCDRTPDRYNKIPNRVELTTEERKDLIFQAKQLGAKTVEFPGAGEPMIDHGFWEIIEYIHSLDMISVIFTSGYHLDEKSINRLFENNATIFLKFNHNKTDVQDKMVGVKGYGALATRARDLLVARGFNQTIPTRMALDLVVTPKYQDLEEIKDIHRWCRQNNVHNYISTLIPEGLADTKAKLFEMERSDALIREIQTIDEVEFGLYYEPSRPMTGGYKCRQVNVGLFVNLFGEVYDCNGLGRFLGHITMNTLKEIWNAKFAQHVRAPLQDGFCVLRERMWAGVETKGINRKLEEYRQWTQDHDVKDEILESGLSFTGHLGEKAPYKSKKKQINQFPVEQVEE